MTIDEMESVLLDQVLTVRDVMEAWGLTQTQVMMAIYKDRLIARQSRSHGPWLISRASCIRSLGQPENEGVLP